MCIRDRLGTVKTRDNSLLHMLQTLGQLPVGVEKAVIPGFYGSKPDGTIKTFSRGDVYKRQVGDPFKDTSGPSINILIKLTSMVSIVFAGLIVAVHLL